MRRMVEDLGDLWRLACWSSRVRVVAVWLLHHFSSMKSAHTEVTWKTPISAKIPMIWLGDVMTLSRTWSKISRVHHKPSASIPFFTQSSNFSLHLLICASSFPSWHYDKSWKQCGKKTMFDTKNLMLWSLPEWWYSIPQLTIRLIAPVKWRNEFHTTWSSIASFSLQSVKHKKGREIHRQRTRRDSGKDNEWHRVIMIYLHMLCICFAMFTSGKKLFKTIPDFYVQLQTACFQERRCPKLPSLFNKANNFTSGDKPFNAWLQQDGVNGWLEFRPEWA